MDLINILPEILPKMRLQLHANKKIHSLSEIFFYANKFDKENTGLCQVYKFEDFLASIGIFLKTQERSELLKYITLKYPVNIPYRYFVDLFKIDREDIMDLVEISTQVYNKLLDQNGTIVYHDFLNKILIQNHPFMKLFKENVDVAWNKIEYELNFIIGGRDEITLDDFIALQLNILYLLPEDRIPYFIKSLPEAYIF